MDRTQMTFAEAQLNAGRKITKERAVELAHEIETLMDASKELGKRLSFDDQASDFMRTSLETSPGGHVPHR